METGKSVDIQGYLPKDFIWASLYWDTAWKYANKESGYPDRMVFSVYDKSKLEQIRSYSAYKLKEGINSFSEALVAIIRLKFLCPLDKRKFNKVYI